LLFPAYTLHFCHGFQGIARKYLSREANSVINQESTQEKLGSKYHLVAALNVLDHLEVCERRGKEIGESTEEALERGSGH
jgi:hypothetical protein